MELCKIEEKDYAYVEALLVEAFPPNERPPFQALLEKHEQGAADFWMIREEDRNVGIAYLLTVGDVTYLFYFAVDSTCRGKGYGSKAMKAMLEKYKDTSLSCSQLKIMKLRPKTRYRGSRGTNSIFAAVLSTFRSSSRETIWSLLSCPTPIP